MSNEKFTEGPWYTSYRQQTNGMYSQSVYDANSENICVCSWYPVEVYANGVLISTHTNREHNACLIAAAPDMHELLSGIIRSGGTESESTNNAIKEVLARVRGEHG